MSDYQEGYQVEIHDLKTGKTEFEVQVFDEDAEGLKKARQEFCFWAIRCSALMWVRIRCLSDNQIH